MKKFFIIIILLSVLIPTFVAAFDTDPRVVLQNVQSNFDRMNTFKGNLEKNIFIESNNNTVTYKSYLKILRPEKYREDFIIGDNLQTSFDGTNYYFKQANGNVLSYKKITPVAVPESAFKLFGGTLFKTLDFFANFSLNILNETESSIIIKTLMPAGSSNYFLININKTNNLVEKIEEYNVDNDRYHTIVFGDYSRVNNVWFPAKIIDEYSNETRRTITIKFSDLVINADINNDEFVIQ